MSSLILFILTLCIWFLLLFISIRIASILVTILTTCRRSSILHLPNQMRRLHITGISLVISYLCSSHKEWFITCILLLNCILWVLMLMIVPTNLTSSFWEVLKAIYYITTTTSYISWRRKWLLSHSHKALSFFVSNLNLPMRHVIIMLWWFALFKVLIWTDRCLSLIRLTNLCLLSWKSIAMMLLLHNLLVIVMSELLTVCWTLSSHKLSWVINLIIVLVVLLCL